VRALGPLQHLQLSSERPTSCAPLRFEISPRAAEVPSGTQSAPMYLPLGLVKMRIEWIRESPLGLEPRQQQIS
jgi:hypothetical protein